VPDLGEHAEPQTTVLYDRRKKEVARHIAERVLN
jgi:hypothetical protein